MDKCDCGNEMICYIVNKKNVKVNRKLDICGKCKKMVVKDGDEINK